MTRLFGSEMTRLASRRLFRWILVLFIAALVLVAALVYVNDEGHTFTAADMTDALMGLSFPLLMFGWLVGASAIGAEWGNRTVSALLTWEPRRTRVLLTKAVAAVASTALWVLALEIVFTAAMLPVAAAGEAAFDGRFSWADHAGVGGRIVLVSAAASAIGFALATIGKNTGAALGGGMAYLLVVETLIRTYRGEWSEWLLSSNIVRVIEGAQGAVQSRSRAEAALLLAAYAGALLVVALWVFRRREMA